MEEDDHAGKQGAFSEISQWLWSKPLGQHNADQDDDEEVTTGQEELFLPEEQVRARHLFSQKTISREVPAEQSRSGRVYQTARHSLMECSRPTMSIRSQWSFWSSSPRPLPKTPVPSLTSWTRTVNSTLSPPQLTNSGSQSPGGGRLQRLSSTEWNGTTLPRTNSGSSGKAMVLHR
uniref:Movement protein n=1 Tax=Brassica yellows virus TaxID=1046403 RepID=A0A0C5BD71_9VIRU|nr:movement protein [Brassica yellows virus]AJL34497.1 movement protein [Brassica yellows virus]QBY26424.1 P4 protein [Brassica yellows virus]